MIIVDMLKKLLAYIKSKLGGNHVSQEQVAARLIVQEYGETLRLLAKE
ncbi:hypothetical protein HYX70_01430 [Candidatus Saccharibacteria bacterium]|nr:hypothetical protein [Candidatus Saccharibacteria bacterium]